MLIGKIITSEHRETETRYIYDKDHDSTTNVTGGEALASPIQSRLGLRNACRTESVFSLSDTEDASDCPF